MSVLDGILNLWNCGYKADQYNERDPSSESGLFKTKGAGADVKTKEYRLDKSPTGDLYRYESGLVTAAKVGLYVVTSPLFLVSKFYQSGEAVYKNGFKGGSLTDEGKQSLKDLAKGAVIVGGAALLYWKRPELFGCDVVKWALYGAASAVGLRTLVSPRGARENVQELEERLWSSTPHSCSKYFGLASVGNASQKVGDLDKFVPVPKQEEKKEQ